MGTHVDRHSCADARADSSADATMTTVLTFCCIAFCHECEEEVVQLLHLLDICQLVRLELKTLHTIPTELKNALKTRTTAKESHYHLHAFNTFSTQNSTAQTVDTSWIDAL